MASPSFGICHTGELYVSRAHEELEYDRGVLKCQEGFTATLFGQETQNGCPEHS